MLPKLVPPAIATFLACCDEVICDESFPTLGTALIKGHLTLVLGDLYFKAPSDEIKIEMLKHEVGHFALGHIGRCGEREPMPWNLVCDAAIHQQEICNYKLVDLVMGMQSITYDKLECKTGGPIPPTPPEIMLSHASMILLSVSLSRRQPHSQV
jgi:hypothetical protein